MSSHVPQEMSHMVSLVYYKIWDFCIFFCMVPYSLQVHNIRLQMSEMSHLFFCFLSNTSCINRLKKSFLSSFSFFSSYCTNSLIIVLFRLRMFVMSYHFFCYKVWTIRLERLYNIFGELPRITLHTMPVWKFHTLARSSCQPLLFALPPPPAVAAIITVFHCKCAAGCSHPLPHTRRCRCMLSHTLPSAERCCMHATSAAHCRMHAGCLPSIAIVPLSAAALLLHTAARTPFAPLLPSPVPPPPLLVPCWLIAKKR